MTLSILPPAMPAPATVDYIDATDCPECGTFTVESCDCEERAFNDFMRGAMASQHIRTMHAIDA